MYAAMTMLQKHAARARAFVRKPFYAPAEVAQLLGVSKQTILNRIHQGQLTAVRVSSRVYRVPLGGLMRFLRPDAPSRVRWLIELNAKVHLDAFDRELAREHPRSARG